MKTNKQLRAEALAELHKKRIKEYIRLRQPRKCK